MLKRSRYKDLRLEEGKATKETRELQREINKLDKSLKDVDAEAGQFQRNVGNYPDALGDALKSVKALAIGLGALKGSFDGVKTSLNSTQEGSEDLRVSFYYFRFSFCCQNIKIFATFSTSRATAAIW